MGYGVGATTLIDKTVSNGLASLIYETTYVYSGKTVVVRYAVVNGIIKISDAWIKTCFQLIVLPKCRH